MLLLLGCTEPAPAPAPLAPPDAPAIRVLSYNVNFEQFDLATIDAILDADADVVFLQETTAQWEAALRAGLATAYPFIELRHHDPDGGMGVLSREPFETVAWIPSPVGGFPAWCLALDTAIGPLNALHVHLHPPLDEDGSLLAGYFTTDDERQAEIAAYLQCFGGPPDLAAGDFNEGEGDAIDHVLAAGLRDAASAFPPPTRTWRWDTRFGELEGRPDHVFHADTFAPRRVDVLETGGSDHRPLRVELARLP